MRQPLLGKPKKNMDKLDNLPSAYKITNMRTHLQAVVKYYNEKTGGLQRDKKGILTNDSADAESTAYWR